MRHAVRADMLPNWTDFWTLEERMQCPHDSPIADYTLPATYAVGHKRSTAYESISRVVSSPFRRCLQTAGVMCREHGITTLEVDFGLCEGMSHVRALGTKELTFLPLDRMQDAVNSDVISEKNINIVIVNRENCLVPVDTAIRSALAAIVDLPQLSENQMDTNSRFRDCYRRIIARHTVLGSNGTSKRQADYMPADDGSRASCTDSMNPLGSVLCVTHWEGVSLLLSSLLQCRRGHGDSLNRHSYCTVSECGFIALDLFSNHYITSYGVEYS
jgi:hypothetical protein